LHIHVLVSFCLCVNEKKTNIFARCNRIVFLEKLHWVALNLAGYKLMAVRWLCKEPVGLQLALKITPLCLHIRLFAERRMNMNINEWQKITIKSHALPCWRHPR